ncbi:rhomboid family protein [Flectobacillus roseus]|uniref:Rhomboid family intramembrane serine protease n=1 Tax=Flectobacillus roseus TaxID=502259 RepID=A0ABT6Y4W5_9BACT|nr:rhomboid family intramembrane serine protease [Flectobacillus roseus]MDI9858519.1 rhomboid family intramembrane serine protease [Flectobacillus roseus]
MIAILIIGITLVFTYQGFRDFLFFDKYKFHVFPVLLQKDYKRLLTSGFLHVDWLHFFFNMYSLYVFSGLTINIFGEAKFLILYLGSIVGGNLISVLIHRKDDGYTSVGASGGVFGIMFASIAVFPDMGLRIMFIPISLPAWIFGLLYLGVSIYGIKSNKDNIGHDAHLGGAIIGMLLAILFIPEILQENLWVILLLLIPSLVFIYIIVTRPYLLLIDNFYFKNNQQQDTIDERYNANKVKKQHEIDEILDKIASKGIDSLSTSEKAALEEYSKRMN